MSCPFVALCFGVAILRFPLRRWDGVCVGQLAVRGERGGFSFCFHKAQFYGLTTAMGWSVCWPVGSAMGEGEDCSLLALAVHARGDKEDMVGPAGGGRRLLLVWSKLTSVCHTDSPAVPNDLVQGVTGQYLPC